MSTQRLPSFFLCHGGGPWPWMQGPMRSIFNNLEAMLQQFPSQLPTRPDAILIVSGHWEEAEFNITSAEAPGMVYDYSGFPQGMYAIRYGCPGSPELAQRVVHMLREAGLAARINDKRGYDHGTYSLLRPMYPSADIPVVQLSLQASLDLETHFRAGQALAPLRDENILIIGSGMSCHEHTPNMSVASPPFDMWLHSAVVETHPSERKNALMQWDDAPHARDVHPREDHLVPLIFAAGTAMEEPASRIYSDRLMGYVSVSSFRFGAT